MSSARSNQLLVGVVAGAGALALAVLALWAWQEADLLSRNFGVARPDVLRPGIRCGAAVGAVVSQWLLLQWVIGHFFPVRRGDRLAWRVLQGLAMVALISAVALGLASR